MSNGTAEILCGGCGCKLERVYAGDPRIPCPDCASTVRTFNVDISETIKAMDEVTTEFTPGDQDRDWRDRWAQIQREAAELIEPIDVLCTRESIFARRNRLLAFYVQCFHLRDALIAEAPQNTNKTAVDAQIKASPALSLIADLCNREKHVKLTKPPWSGTYPTFGKVSATADGQGHGWQLALEIVHGQRTLDGLDLAKDARCAWEVVLRALGLT